MPRTSDEIDKLKRRIASIDAWYHRIDLGDGIETPGHLRMSDYLASYAIPERLDGKRVLDVGASTGYFAYEFERRGAEVVAIELPGWGDHDWTPRYRANYAARAESERSKIDRDVMLDGFTVVGEALGSKRVKREFRAIYDLSPADLGTFDIVFSGAMLMHVRDPILGIQRMRACCKPDGRLIVSVSMLEHHGDEPLARFAGEWDQCNWWQLSPAALKKILVCCDFDRFEHEGTYVLEDVTKRYRDPTFVCHALPRRAAP